MLLIDAAAVLGGLLVGLALDALIGDPRWLYRRVPHPVALIGRAGAWLEGLWLDRSDPVARQRRRGALACVLVVGLAAGVGAALQRLCLALPHAWLWLGLLMSTLLAWRGLHEHVARVAEGLDAGIAEARRSVAHIVGRDPESLDRHAVARAAIESTAENFSDGVVAPLFWGLLLGLPGMLAYKAINTLDSMVGHRSPRYLDFGRFAARLDDAANWLPARLAALLLVIAAWFVPDARPPAGWRAIWREARRHRSPNAGWPEAAIAGCLGLRLAGPRRYGGEIVDDAWMGEGRAEALAADVQRALGLLAGASLAAAALLALFLLALATGR